MLFFIIIIFWSFFSYTKNLYLLFTKSLKDSHMIFLISL